MLVVKRLKALRNHVILEKILSFLKQSVLEVFNSSSVFSSYVATVNLMLYVELSLNIYRFFEMLAGCYLEMFE